MVKPVFLFILTIFIASCGSSKRSPLAQNFVGVSFMEVKELSNEEKNQVLRLCNEFKSFNIRLRSSLLGKSFNYEYEKIECNKNKTSTFFAGKVIEISPSKGLEVKNTTDGSSSHFYNIQSDKFGDLAPLCEQVYRGDNPSNTLSNDDGAKQYLLFLQGRDGFDGFSVVHFKKDADKSFAETRYKVQLNSLYSYKDSSAPVPSMVSLNGFVTTTEEYKSCVENSPVKTQVTIQSLIPGGNVL